jgi:AcrR family transcriptional regulator
MPRLTRPARRALVEERQKQLLDAAARVFAEKGFERATIRDVARAAGVAEGSIYLYFKNKQDLLVHLPRRFIQPPLEAFRATHMPADGPAPPPDELLTFIAENITRVVTQNRELVRALFNSLPTMDAAARATYLREGPSYALGMLETYIRAQQTAGVFRAEPDPEVAARALPGMLLFFLLVQEVLQPEGMVRFEYDRVISTVIPIYLHGLLAQPAAPPDAPATPLSHSTPPRPQPRRTRPRHTRTRRTQNIKVE